MSIKNKFEKYLVFRKEKLKISSEEIKKGDIFIALKGKNFHGNKFISSAIEKGARFCLTDNKYYEKNEKVIYVNNIFEYLKNLAKRKRQLYNGEVIGITGSAGKTTLKETLAFFLKKNNTISFSKKSYNNELGVLISILNVNLDSAYAIFELGTNNFGEIKNLTKIIQPSQIFITNIQSTHLENFKSQSNIAREKSDIFVSKYNKNRKKLYLNITTKQENIILQKAYKEKKLKLIRIDNFSKKYFIKNILKKKQSYEVNFSINKKLMTLNFKNPIKFRLNNLLFCFAFFSENYLEINTIAKRYKYLRPVEGRGLIHKLYLNNIKINIIDESYNANPDTMIQSIEYFNNIKKVNRKKILILGNMNELGHNSYKFHLNLLKKLDKFLFRFVILCGKFYERSVKKLLNPNNELICLDSKNKIMTFLNKNLHNDDTILIKCSNSTEINKFAKELLKKGNLI